MSYHFFNDDDDFEAVEVIDLLAWAVAHGGDSPGTGEARAFNPIDSLNRRRVEALAAADPAASGGSRPLNVIDFLSRRAAKISPHSVITGASFCEPVEKTENRGKETLDPRPSPASVEEVMDLLEDDYLTFSRPSSDGSMKLVIGGEDETHHFTGYIMFLEAQGLLLNDEGSGGKFFSRRYEFGLPVERERPVRVLTGSFTKVVPVLEIRGGGGLCAALAPAAREVFPDGRAARRDVKLDLVAGEAGFDRLFDWAQKFARGKVRPGPPVMDPKGSLEGGRTFTMGSRESSVFLRVYEKGKQLLGAGQDADSRLIRIEFEMKDFKSWEKAELFGLLPADLFRSKGGWGRHWLRGAISALGLVKRPELIVQRHMVTARPVRTLDDTVDHSVKQYGPAETRLAVNQLVEERFAGDRAAAVLTKEEVVDRILENRRLRILAAGTVDKELEKQGLTHEEEPADRARRMAEEAQARARLAANREACHRRRMLKVIGEVSASASPEVLDAIRQSAARAKARADEMHEAAALMKDANALAEAAAFVAEEREALEAERPVLEAANAALRHEKEALEAGIDAMLAAA